MNFSVNNSVLIMGGGLSGLSAGFCLAQARRPVSVIEADSEVGGLSRTIRHGNFRFDLGGHRFFTKNENTDRFVRDILKGKYVDVHRKSKIYLQNNFFDYPLRPSNAIFGLGLGTTVKAVADYGKEKIKSFFSQPRHVSLEDWVVSNFGRTLFTIYFKEYSEKVWGIDCRNISEEWVSKRIEGLSLGVAIRNAFFKYSGRKVPTLTDKFIYPPLGIGEISDRLKEAIETDNTVRLSTRVSRVHHRDSRITGLTLTNCTVSDIVKAGHYISSIPVTHLVTMMEPSAPDDVLSAASKLRYRDLVVATIMLNKEKVTDLTWLYLPEKSMPLGRIHEPKNWSPHMAPQGKTHIVAEYFCFQGDRIWNSSDAELTDMTTEHLAKLGFISRRDVFDSCIVRVPKAYPVFEVGYNEHYAKVLDYLRPFRNLHITGRTGMFRYYNIDHAIESGIAAAMGIIGNN